jgi:acyl carrier protein
LFPEEKVKSEEIKKYLVERLPNYMVPNQIFILEKMPVSANGKIDRKILMAFDSEKEEIINSNPSVIEQNLSNLVTELLGIKTVRITDNFFDLGGNSLMAIRLTSLLFERYELKLEVVKIFEFPTIKDLAGFLSSVISNLNTISSANTASRRALKYAHKSNLRRKN